MMGMIHLFLETPEVVLMNKICAIWPWEDATLPAILILCVPGIGMILLGNGLTGLSMATSVVSTSIAVANGTDNTSTWTNAAIGIGGGVLTIVGAPVVVTGAAIVGVVWGVGQLFYGDEINGWIDNNFGYR